MSPVVRLWARAGVAATAASLALAGTAASADATVSRQDSDFDGDGRADIVVTAHSNAVEVPVAVLYSGSGWRLHDLATVAPTNAVADTATCNLDGDGYDDLVVGVTGGGGGVVVMYGSADGLGRSQWWSQASPGVAGDNEKNDAMGSSVACGHIGSDRYDDIVAGMPGEDVGTVRAAGAVLLLRGSATGVTAAGSQVITQASAGVAGTPSFDDEFGHDVEVGDLTGDGLDEIVITSPFEGTCGGFQVLKGSSSGWTPTGSKAVYSASLGWCDNGYEVAIGNFDGTAAKDLAVFSDYGTPRGGAVGVFYGSSSITTTPRQWLTQNTTGVPGTSEADDRWGRTLATGDLTGDGRDELLVGADESLGSTVGAGSVTVLRGSATGLTGNGAQMITQNSAGVPGTAESYDQFGLTLAVADRNGDGRGDAVIGTPNERIGAGNPAGYLTLVNGTSTGLASTGITGLTKDAAGLGSDLFWSFTAAVDG